MRSRSRTGRNRRPSSIPQDAGRLTGMFQRLPRHFEQQTLLRIDPPGLARSDAEKAAVELVDFRQEAAMTGHDAAGRFGIRVEIHVDVEPIRRDRRDRVDAVTQQPPERIRTVCARNPTANSNNGDGLPRGRLERDNAPLRVLQRQKRALERGERRFRRVELLGLIGHWRPSLSSNSNSTSASLMSASAAASSEGSERCVAAAASAGRSSGNRTPPR